MKAQTGCDAVMIGRRAIGFPWIFSQINALFEGREPRAPELAERFDLMEDYARTSVRCMGEKTACRVLRSRLCWFVKGLPHNSKFRENITRLQSEAEAVDHIRLFEQQLLHSA
jgi:tRNA-dihydrouridine synthase